MTVQLWMNIQTKKIEQTKIKLLIKLIKSLINLLGGEKINHVNFM